MGCQPGGQCREVQGYGRGRGRQRAHLAPCVHRQAAVEPPALPARVPDGEGCPALQDLLLQEADAVVPDGGPVGRAHTRGAGPLSSPWGSAPSTHQLLAE